MSRSGFTLCLAFIVLARAATAADSGGAGEDSELTFNKDIAPIIFENCVSCHRPGEVAPFPLTNYSEVKKRGRLIAAVTESRYMPPWHAAPADVEYRDERRLSDAQIARIQSWGRQSTLEGDSKDFPPLPDFAQGWQLGEPDLLLEVPEPYDVPADGSDIYRGFAIPVNLPEDKWIRAIEYKPQASRSSYHAVLVIDTSGEALAAAAAEPGAGFHGLATFFQFQEWGSKEFLQSGMAGGGNSFGSWSVGGTPRILPAGLAYRLPKRGAFVIQAHYHPSGKPEADQARVGLHFADEPPARTLVGILVPQAFGRRQGIIIPAGESNYSLTGSFTTPVDIDVFSAGGHAHYLAKEMKMTALLPDGASKTLLWIDRWDFNWQDQYVFREPLSLPAGTRLDVVIRYDNSADNPANPHDPPRRVRWGLGSEDEMGGMAVAVAPRREEDLPLLEEARATALREGNSRTRSSIDEVESNRRLFGGYDKDRDKQLSREERKALFDDLTQRRKKSPK